jgi:hypothetical protein
MKILSKKIFKCDNITLSTHVLIICIIKNNNMWTTFLSRRDGVAQDTVAG